MELHIKTAILIVFTFFTIGSWAQTVLASESSHGEYYLRYDRLGVYFCRTNDVVSVGVMEPSGHSARTARGIIGIHELVPGVGALGIKIGDSEDVLTSLPNIKALNRERLAINPRCDSVDVEFANGTGIVLVTSGKVKDISASQCSFRTPEGVTEKSDPGSIRRIYGKPDEEHYSADTRVIQVRRMPRSVTVITLLVFGCITGALLRKLRKRTIESSRMMFILAVGVPGFFSGMGALICNMFPLTPGLPKLGLLPGFIVYNVVLATACACAGGFAMELFRVRFTTTSDAVRLVIILAAGYLGSLLAFFLMPGILWMLLTKMLVFGLFNIGLFAYGRDKVAKSKQTDSV